jgi:hypothetical protein
MHEDRTVRRESIVAWYRFYSRKLPRMYPERSDVDLVRTIALWMELTDKGGRPGFPFDYRSDLEFSTVDVAREPRGSVLWLVGEVVLGAGVIALFFSWKVGLVLVLSGVLIEYAAYRVRGGATNSDLLTEGTTLYEREGRRVIEWARAQRPSEGC